ncbi:MAG TPA: hypothetical protein PLG47_04685, partial [Candidatus Dojkabacteria bacterium]|nr:hypothetical protein [Candidatus Dojkabacteria bacterium]
TNAEKSSFLTKGEDILIQEYTKVKDWNSIYTVVENITIAPSAITQYGNKAYYINLGTGVTDFRYYVSSRCMINKTAPIAIDDEKINCEIIDKENAYRFIVTGYNKPYFKYPKVFLEYDRSNAREILVILIDYYSSIVDEFELTYVRKPAGIDIDGSVTSELPEYLHKDVVSLAVQEAVKSLYISKTPQTPRQ